MLPNSERVLFSSESGLRIGAFRRYPWNAEFEDSGPIQGWLLVFPRTSVVIQHAGHEPVVADPTRVMLYNRGQEYRRRAVGERGDECEWFSFPPSFLDEPFRAVCASVDSRTYLLQRRITESNDPLFVEEGMRVLLDRCTRRRRPTRHRELAEACRAELAGRMSSKLSLVSMAKGLGVSPFHLSRAFHDETGMTLYAYLHDLRLRSALERVRDGEDLSAIAQDYGYASHSHFTARFRRVFGETPSRARS